MLFRLTKYSFIVGFISSKRTRNEYEIFRVACWNLGSVCYSLFNSFKLLNFTCYSHICNQSVGLKNASQSTITEKTAAVHFTRNALRSKIFKRANGCLLKNRRKTGGRFVYSAKISHH